MNSLGTFFCFQPTGIGSEFWFGGIGSRNWQELVLQLRLLELGDHPGDFLRRAPEPPALEAWAPMCCVMRTGGPVGFQPKKDRGFQLRKRTHIAGPDLNPQNSLKNGFDPKIMG